MALGWLWGSLGVALCSPLSDFSFQHFSFCPIVALVWLARPVTNHESRITSGFSWVRCLKPPLGDDISISYSYNWRGTIGYRGCPRAMYRLKLGLGHLSKDAAPEPQVLVPSEMYTIADTRPGVGQAGLDGSPKMQLYGFGETKEAPPPHARGYNILFADGHVTFVKRSDYLCPPRTAHNWNRDNQPHPETWAPTDQWAAQN
jgi:prepilin-type processing-associated H-X9-DG protein